MSFRFLIYLGLILIGFVAGAVKFKRLTAPFKFLVGLLLVTFISEAISRIVAIKIHNNSPVYHFYVLLLVSFFSMIYFLQIPQKGVRIFIIVSCLSFLILSSLNSIFLQNLYVFPSLSIIIGSVIIILFSLVLFKYQVDNTMFFNRQNIIWFNTSVLIYFTIQIFSWGIYSYLIRKNLNSKIISDVAFIANVLFYSSIALLFITYKKNKEVNADL